MIVPGFISPCQHSFISARAFPCRCAPGDNLALHHALRAAPKGTVIVCDAGGRLDVGHFGELMALDAKNRELAGLIINGAVRDAAELDDVDFPVFCAGYAPAQSTKRRAGVVGSRIRLKGVRVTEGDYIVADRDAVAVVPKDAWGGVLKQIAEVCAVEHKIRARLARGERLFDILF
ncbi:MAG: RraA family protein [Acidobacteriota bacterium]|nr:RraA family protein [Acidobacteriota bacterium]